MNGQRGFTLVEMLVVIAIMMMAMAMMLPAVALWQKKTDTYATVNVIQTVHAIQQRNARQFGSAGVVYGYTIRSDRAGIEPWLVGIDGNKVGVDRGDIGKQMFWKTSAGVDFIEFVDLVEPKSSSNYVVSFEPRTGFPHVDTAPVALATISDPATAAVGGSFDLRSKRSPYPTQFEVVINITGAIDVRGKR